MNTRKDWAAHCHKCEMVGDSYLKLLNDQHSLFKDLQRQDLMSRYDWIGKTFKGSYKSVIELKVRSSIDYDTLFIEKGKYEYLMGLYERTGKIPFYINFNHKGEAIVFILPQHRDLELVSVKIYNQMKQEFEIVERYLLPKSKGHYYKYELS